MITKKNIFFSKFNQSSLCDLMQLPEAPLLHQMQLTQLAYLWNKCNKLKSVASEILIFKKKNIYMTLGLSRMITEVKYSSAA